MIRAATWAITAGRSMRPWMVAYGATLAVVIVASNIAWVVTDAVWKA